jgi:hypothetical protein
VEPLDVSSSDPVRRIPVRRIAVRRIAAAALIAASLIAASPIAPPPVAAAPADRPSVDPQTHPLAQAPKGRSATEQALRFPAWLAERPFWLLGRGLEGTLTWAEQKEVIEKIEALPEWLASRHLILGPSAQGTGAGTGLLFGTFAGVGPGTILATTDWTAREYQAHVLQLRMPLSRSVGVRAFGRYDRRTRDNFFGIGSATSPEDRTQYELDAASAGLALGWRPGGWILRAEGGWADYRPVEDPADDEHPSTVATFPGLPGEGGATIVSGGLTAGRQTLDSRIEAGFLVFDGTDGDEYGFHRYELTLYRAVPVFRGDRVLAFRLHGVTTDPQGDRAVPFWMLPEVSSRNGLRAYEPWRFRDRDAVVMNVEYRFPVWDIGVPSGAGIESVLFFDAGRVSGAIEDDLVWREFKSDAGFGFRVRTRAAVLARINAAFAADDWRLELVTGRDF